MSPLKSNKTVPAEVLAAIVEVLKDKETRRLLFVTGAGLSVESGLPTYRGVAGLYNETETPDELPIETILSAEVMESNPALTWKYLHEMETFLRGKMPNRAHKIIAQFEQFFQTVVLTQNIDAFHRQAGSSAVVEIHGAMHRLKCTADVCTWTAEVKDFSHLPALPILPSCPLCKGLVRPDVTLFGEPLPRQALKTLEKHYQERFDVVFSIGTTAYFPYIQAPVHQATLAGILTIEVNPDPTIISQVFDYSLRTEAGPFLAELWEAYIKASATPTTKISTQTSP